MCGCDCNCYGCSCSCHEAKAPIFVPGPAQTFYMVWVENSSVPTKKHYAHADAKREAERLAIQLGRPVHVLTALEVCEPAKNVVWKQMSKNG